MDIENQNQNSRHSFSVPIKFINDQFSKVKMNNAEVDQIKQNKKVQGHQDKKIAKSQQCRICLEPQYQGHFISPCKCTGSMSVAHEHCLAQWIRRLIDVNTKIRARCEVCDAEFNYKITHERIFDLNELKMNYQSDKKSFRIFAIFYFLFILGFLALIVLVATANSSSAAAQKLKQVMMPSNGTLIIYICSLLIYAIIILVISILFIGQYVVRTQLTVKDVKDYREPKTLKKNYKIYFRR